ncbi:MAG: hypothetical protein ABSC37_02400 [Xanthobacteraceae bacterium]
MNRKLAKELTAAGFPIQFYQVGHRFYPHETSSGWSEAAQEHGVTITPYELQNHLHDIEDGYYCPTLPDLIEAGGDRFARLFVETTFWTAESRDSEKYALADSPEEAVAKLWFALHRKKS